MKSLLGVVCNCTGCLNHNLCDWDWMMAMIYEEGNKGNVQNKQNPSAFDIAGVYEIVAFPPSIIYLKIKELYQMAMKIVKFTCKQDIAMNTTRIRQEINEYLQQADDRFLKLIHGMVVADRGSSPIVGFRTNYQPITKEELIARAERSEKDFREGRVKTAKQIREEMKDW